MILALFRLYKLTNYVANSDLHNILDCIHIYNNRQHDGISNLPSLLLHSVCSCHITQYIQDQTSPHHTLPKNMFTLSETCM